MKLKIGTATLTGPRNYIITHACAAWFTEIEAQPQTVDLYVDEHDFDSNGHIIVGTVAFGFDGVVVGSDYTPLYFGCSIGERKVDTDLGAAKTRVFTPYAYAIADAIINGGRFDGIRFDLSDGYAAEKVEVDSEHFKTICVIARKGVAR